jgi:restriction system protein
MDLQPSLPTYDDLFEPTIKALKALGGSGSIQEIYDKVCALEGYSEEQQSVLGKKGSQTEIAYRLAWARTYLKTYGLLENVGRGVWSLTEAGRNLQTIDRKEINRVVQRKSKKASGEASDDSTALQEIVIASESLETLALALKYQLTLKYG